MKKQFWSLLVVSGVLVGCASGVKLDDVPVEDKSATSSASGQGVAVQGIGAGQGGAQTGVASVTASQASTGQGPVGIAHVVFFDYDSFVLRPEARPVIASHAQFLQANKQQLKFCHHQWAKQEVQQMDSYLSL
jgi:peptidoglycan-associated lipoprotein